MCSGEVPPVQIKSRSLSFLHFSVFRNRDVRRLPVRLLRPGRHGRLRGEHDGGGRRLQPLHQGVHTARRVNPVGSSYHAMRSLLKIHFPLVHCKRTTMPHLALRRFPRRFMSERPLPSWLLCLRGSCVQNPNALLHLLRSHSKTCVVLTAHLEVLASVVAALLGEHIFDCKNGKRRERSHLQNYTASRASGTRVFSLLSRISFPAVVVSRLGRPASAGASPQSQSTILPPASRCPPWL